MGVSSLHKAQRGKSKHKQMKSETIAKVGVAIVFIALLIQLTFILANATGNEQALTRTGKAMLGITW